MLKSFFNNWNFSRVLRLSLGLIVLVQAIMSKDTMLAFFAALFVAMPIFNVGCCSTKSCAMPAKKITNKEIEFEEIK